RFSRDWSSDVSLPIFGIEPGDELRVIHAEILDGTHLPPAAPASPDRRWTRVAAVALVFVLLLTIQASQPPRSPAAPPPAVAQVRSEERRVGTAIMART